MLILSEEKILWLFVCGGDSFWHSPLALHSHAKLSLVPSESCMCANNHVCANRKLLTSLPENSREKYCSPSPDRLFLLEAHLPYEGGGKTPQENKKPATDRQLSEAALKAAHI